MKLDNLNNNNNNNIEKNIDNNAEKNIDNNVSNINTDKYNPDIMLSNKCVEIENLVINNNTSNVEIYNPDTMIGTYEGKEVEKGEPIKQKQDGIEREKIVNNELKEKYPEEEGYQILDEVYLRDQNGNIVKDPETNEARRVDFVVVKDNVVVDMVEVTSPTAEKLQQTAKETRIRLGGGNYIKDNNGNLIKIPNNVQTRIERVKLEGEG